MRQTLRLQHPVHPIDVVRHIFQNRARILDFPLRADGIHARESAFDVCSQCLDTVAYQALVL